MANGCSYCIDAETFSPEPMMEEEIHEAEEAGSFSPELLHGDENEEAIDPEEDRAILVTSAAMSLCPLPLISWRAS